MLTCHKCDKKFSQLQIIDGKKRNLQSRKYCLECSPFGSRNRKKLEIDISDKKCIECGKPNNTNKKRCPTCNFHHRQNQITEKVYGNIVGYKCWKCDYDKGKEAVSVLEFHHVDPSEKLFNLNMRKLMGRAWKDVWEEMQKCVSLCCLCHREYHAGFITDEEIEKIYKEKWKNILGNEDY